MSSCRVLPAGFTPTQGREAASGATFPDVHPARSVEFGLVSCCDGGNLVYHGDGGNGGNLVHHGDGGEIVGGRLLIADLWARHGEWHVTSTAAPYRSASCRWHVRMPAVIWGLGADNFFAHFVGESLFVLFQTIEQLWRRSLNRQPTLDEFRQNLLVRWDFDRQAMGQGVGGGQEGEGRSRLELLQMLTSGPVNISLADVRWHDERTCFDRLVVGLNFSALVLHHWSGASDSRTPAWRAFAGFFSAAAVAVHFPTLVDVSPPHVVMAQRSRRRIVTDSDLVRVMRDSGAAVRRMAFARIDTHQVMFQLSQLDVLVTVAGSAGSWALFMPCDSVVLYLIPYIPLDDWLLRWGPTGADAWPAHATALVGVTSIFFRSGAQVRRRGVEWQWAGFSAGHVGVIL